MSMLGYYMALSSLKPSGGSIPTDGLVFEYLLNNSGADTSGNGYNATVTGATATTNILGDANSALLFGNNNTDKVIYSSAIPYSNNLSISLWFYNTANQTTSFQRGRLLELWQGDYNNNIYLGIKNMQLFFGAFSSGNTLFDSISLNTWYHIVAIRTPNSYNMYINGVLSTTSYSIANTIANFNNGIRIGQCINAESPLSFAGKIDNVRCYNRILNQTEVTQLYNELIV